MSDYHIPTISAEDAIARLTSERPFLLDVRKKAARAQSGEAVDGAVWRDPFRLPFDADLTDAAAPTIVFCVHGHEVSQFAAAWLLMHGVDAVYVRGGFEALKRAGAPLSALTPESEQ